MANIDEPLPCLVCGRELVFFYLDLIGWGRTRVCVRCWAELTLETLERWKDERMDAACKICQVPISQFQVQRLAGLCPRCAIATLDDLNSHRDRLIRELRNVERLIVERQAALATPESDKPRHTCRCGAKFYSFLLLMDHANSAGANHGAAVSGSPNRPATQPSRPRLPRDHEDASQWEDEENES